MADVDKELIKKNNTNLKNHINELIKDIKTIKDAKKTTDELKKDALDYDGTELTDTYSIPGTYTFKNYYAKVEPNIEQDGNIIRDFDTLIDKFEKNIKSLSDYTDNIIPAALKDIEDDISDAEDGIKNDTGGGGGGGGGGGSSKKTSPEEYFKETELESNAANFPTTPNPANTATPEDPRQGNNEPTFDNTHTYSNTSTTNNSQNPSSTTSSDDPKPSATVPTGGASGSGGGSAAGTHHTYYEPTEADENSSALINDDGTIKTTTEDQDKDALADSLINRGISRVIPKSNGNKTVQRGSAVIPIASGLTAAAAAGLGGKAFLDRTSNNDSDEDDNESDIEKDNYNDDHQELEEVNNNKNEDKSWLYGMGVGLSTVGSGGNSNQDDDELEE